MPRTAQLSEAVPKPDHVPDSAVYDFDFFADPALIENAPARALTIAREAPPVFWTPRNGGHWLIASRSAVFNAARDHDAFTVEMISYEEILAMTAALPPGAAQPLIPLPNSIDPPRHTMYRAPLQGAFSPRAMMALKGEISQLAAELIEAVKSQGRCEFMSAIGEPLPVQVFLKMFGLPIERQHEYRAIVKEHFAATGREPGGVQGRLRKVAEIMNDTILDRRDNPREDIISLLWQTEFNGKPASLHDLENYCVMLFLAGLDTVMNGMGLGIRHLADNLDLQARLRNDPSLIREASEEMIRRYTFTIPPRFVVKDMNFEGMEMKKGEMALLLLPVADLDPREFPDPEEFDLDRANKVHIAFGAGPHRCLGSNLARIELQTLYEEILARLPEFRIDPTTCVRYHGGNVWGPEELHLVW